MHPNPTRSTTIQRKKVSLGPVRKLRFHEADEASAAISGIDLRISIQSPACRQWVVTEIDLGAAVLTAGQMGAAMTAQAGCDPDRVSVSLMTWHADACTMNGANRSGRLAFLPQGGHFICAMRRPVDWIKLTLAPQDLEREYIAATGRPFEAPAGVTLIQPGFARLGTLQASLQSAVTLAENRPHLLERAESRAELGKALLGALVRSLSSSVAKETVPHGLLARRLHEYFEARDGEVLLPSDLCLFLSINERSLRRLFASMYGTSPGRFLRLRRLQQARRELSCREPAPGSVTEVGVRQGFFDLGRFAADYRGLFGELPSATLERARRREAP
jgi:AraC-like DNA-binding protein